MKCQVGADIEFIAGVYFGLCFPQRVLHRGTDESGVACCMLGTVKTEDGRKCVFPSPVHSTINVVGGEGVNDESLEGGTEEPSLSKSKCGAKRQRTSIRNVLGLAGNLWALAGAWQLTTSMLILKVDGPGLEQMM